MKSIQFLNKPLAVAALFLAAGWLAGPARAQTGEDALRMSQRFPAVTARMVGIGGAGIAGVGDVGALYANPAGLAYLKHSEFTGALSTFGTTDDVQFFTPTSGPQVAVGEHSVRP